MGVKGLANEIKPVVKRTKIRDYIGKTLAVDASLLIYQVVIGIRAGGYDLKNNSGEMTTHIVGLLHKIRSIMNWGIDLIFVFDGKPPKFKGNELDKRRIKKRQAKEKLYQLKKSGTDKEAQTRYFKRSFSINEKIVVDCKRLLDLLGIRYIQAIGEADAILAALSMSNIVDGIITDDLDVIIHGGRKVLKNFSTKGNKNDRPIEEISLNDVLSYLGMNNKQLIDFAILLGTDYTTTIGGVGAVKAKQGIKTYGCALQYVDYLRKHNNGTFIIPDNFDTMYRQIYDYYIDPYGYEYIVTVNNKSVDRFGMIQFLCNENDFNKEEVENSIEKIQLYKDKMETEGKKWFLNHHQDKIIRANRLKAGCYNFPRRPERNYDFRNKSPRSCKKSRYEYNHYKYISKSDLSDNWRVY